MPENKYIYAFDPYLGMRIVYVVKDGFAISLATGHKFKFNPK